MYRYAIIALVLGFVCAYYHVEIGSLFNTLRQELTNKFESKGAVKIWRIQDLEKYRHISIFGHVFDVTTAPKFYGPEGEYNVFTGAEATRSFALSDLSGESLTSSLDGLKPENFESAFEWLKSFKEKYPVVGYIDDLYFDSYGRQKPLMDELRKAVDERNKALREDGERYPPCNSYSSDKESYFDCFDGYKEKGEFFPRMVSTATNPNFRCTCLQRDSLKTGNLALLPGCDEFASKCYFVQKEFEAFVEKLQKRS